MLLLRRTFSPVETMVSISAKVVNINAPMFNETTWPTNEMTDPFPPIQLGDEAYVWEAIVLYCLALLG